MGCDIHAFVETYTNSGDRFYERNYTLFAALAGVRGPGPDPLGLPEDVAATTLYHAKSWGLDGHSHSYISLEDAMKLYKFITYNASRSYYEVFGITTDPKELRDWRVVFWFDN